jgi:polysaccharide export outer membrane protein
MNKNISVLATFLKSVLVCVAFISLPGQAFAQKLAVEDEISTQSTVKSITIVKNENRVTDSKYNIMPGDVLAISVYGNPELEQPEIKVRPDGYATIVPVGEIFTADRNIEDLTTEVYEKLSVYYKDPQISLSVKKFNPASVFVYGAVKKPGFYQQNIETPTVWHGPQDVNAKTDLSLTNIISVAGGINYNADISHIKIVNNLTGYIKEVDLWKLLNEGDTTQNVRLKSGDSVYVPEMVGQLFGDDDFKKMTSSSLFSGNFMIRVLGQVNQPGLINLPAETPFINSAISLAHGYTLDAKKQAVQIYRKTNTGNMSVININPEKNDFVLRPDDIVYVKDRNLIKMVRAADYIARIMTGISTPANTFNIWAKVFDPTREWNYTRR